MRRTSLAVVGAGPAGLSAAVTAARAGVTTVVIDEQDDPGGQLRYRLAEIEPEAGVAPVRPARLREQLLSEATALGVDIQSRTVAWGLFDDHVLGLAGAGASSLLAADIIIIATGSTDRPWPFAGGSLPGVFSARAIQILLHCHRVRPGDRFAIIGGG